MNRCRSRFLAVTAIAGVVIVAFVIPAAASDASIAKKLLVTQADVGSGFSASRGPGTDPTANAKLSKCVGKPSPHRKVVTVDGDVLTNRATGDAILSSVDIVKTTAQFKADVNLFKSPKFSACIKQLVQTQISAGATVVYVNTSSVPLLRPHYGSTFIGALDIQIKNADGTFVHVLEIGLGKGRAEVLAELQSASGTTDVRELETGLDKVNQRLKKTKF